MAMTRSKRRRGSGEEVEARGRILDAAFAAFEQNGYAATSTLEIAIRAGIETGALLVGGQQGENARGLHHGARASTTA
jgi:AcrR family transcriptional regulator